MANLTIASSGGGIQTVENDVTSRHADYLNFAPQWDRIGNVLAGTDAMRASARRYIPETIDHKQHPDAFAAMVARSSFTNFTARTLDGLEGMIFRKDPSVIVPTRFRPRLENMNNAGDAFPLFAKKVCREVLSLGRVGLLADALPKEQHRFDLPTSMLPYVSVYSAHNITNWRVRLIDGQLVYDQVVLREFRNEPAAFGSVLRTRYRVLDLDDEAGGVYRVRIFDQAQAGGFFLSETHYPTKGSNDGRPYLTRIPFVFIGPGDLSADIQKSPLLDIVDANIAHYILSVDYVNALYLTAQPTPVITGWQEGMPTTFRFGGGNMWLLPSGCTAQILEFRGDGLGPLERSLVAKQAEIAELGGRLLQSAATGPETAEAARIRQHSQTSVVSSVARTVSDGIKAAIQFACDWDRTTGKVEVELNQDYIDATPAPQMLSEMLRTWQNGGLRKRDFVLFTQKNELTEPGVTIDQLLDDLEQEHPTLLGRPDPAIMRQPIEPEGADDAEDDDDATGPPRSGSRRRNRNRDRNRNRNRDRQQPPTDDDDDA